MNRPRHRALVAAAAVLVVALVAVLVVRPGSDGSRTASVGDPTTPSTTEPSTVAPVVGERPANAAPVQVDPIVETEIAANGSTTVLVTLTVTPSGTDTERAAQVRAAIDALVASLPSGTVTAVDTQTTTVPVAMFDVDRAGLDALRQRSLVIAVEADQRRSVIRESGEDEIAAAMDSAKAPTAGGSTMLTPAAADTSTAQIGAPAAWAAGWRGAGSVVAVLDSGVQSNHPYLSTGSGSKVIGEACFVTPGGAWTSPCPGGQSMATTSAAVPGSGAPCSVTACSHGTHVAGIIAGGDGTTTASTPSGVVPDAALLAVQVFAVSGSSIGAADSDLYHALQWLYLHRADYPGLSAVNLSLGSGSFSSYCDVQQSVYKYYFDQLVSVGIAVVVAAGNNGYTSSVSSPACVSTAVTVGAVDDADLTTYYSNDGPQLDLMGPGNAILSSVPGSTMATKSGTSMATPAVAGAFAMLRQPTVAGALSLLSATGPDVNASGFHTPRIAVGAATAALPGLVGSLAYQLSASTTDVVLSWSAPTSGAAATSYTVTASPGGAYCSTSTLTCTITNLTPGERHSFAAFAQNASGRGLDVSTIAVTIPDTGPLMALQPERFLDTRTNAATVDDLGEAGGAFAPGEWRTIQIAGRGSVPATGVGAVAVNVTAVNPTATSPAGWLAVAPSRALDPPATSNLNFTAGQTVANMAIVALSPNGTIEVFNKNGSTQVLLDVLGWLPDTGVFTGLAPARVLDTRPTGTTIDAESQGAGAVANEQTVSVRVTDRAGVPLSAGAVVANVTAIGPTANGFVTVHPSDVARPTSSNLNLTAGRSSANLVLTKVAGDGTISLYVRFPAGTPADTTQLVVDVMGWFPATGSFEGLAPARVLDTRPTGTTIDGIGAQGGALQNAAIRSVSVLGRGGVPVNGVSAVAVNVTIVSPSASGFATVFPAPSPTATPPTASNVNFPVGRTVPNMVTADVAPDGTISVYVRFPAGVAGDSAHVLIDVLGWFP